MRTSGVDPGQIHRGVFEYYERLSRVRRFVEEHYAEPLTLQAVARVAGLEKTYFSYFFHAKTGVRFRDWLSWFRVRRSVELMSRCDRSITEVGFAVGFRDLRTFERAFRRFEGASPSEMRDRFRSELARRQPSQLGYRSNPNI